MQNAIIRTLAGLGVCSCSLLSFSADWKPDVLGENYEQKTVELADDYSGKVRTTVVRHKTAGQGNTAVLYLHGYNDYFFQSQLGDSIVAHGYAFYAVDLRKYGRSLLPDQLKFEVRNLKEYFEDLDVALKEIENDGYKNVVFLAHSTGGLTMSYYLSQHLADRPQVKALILNSPFLDMNLSKFQENFLVPVVASMPFKNMKIKQGDSRAYAESLLSAYHGEWEYDTGWKLEVSPDVTSGWISAIHKAQRTLQKGTDIKVPILLMHSDKSIYGDEWTPEFNCGDAVLDVADISKYGKKLGPNVTEFVAEDGLHDLILSRKDVRDKVYAEMFMWLENVLQGK